MTTQRLLTLVGTVWVVLGGGHAEAVQSRCLAGKSKCVSTLASGLLKCYQTAETPKKRSYPDAKGCIEEVVEKFYGGEFYGVGTPPEKGCFAKLEGKAGNDCITVADVQQVQAAMGACVYNFVAAIDPPPLDQSKCGAAKTKCVAILTKGILGCNQKAQTPGKPSNPNDKGCLDKVAVKFDGGADPTQGCFAKLEAKKGGDCLPPLGNTAAVRSTVESCLASVLAQLEGGTTTTTTTTTTTPSSSSTTTTTIPSVLTCGPSDFLDVTATLVYDSRIVGGVFGMFLEVDYPPAIVSIPGSGTASTARARFTNLIGTSYRVVASDIDSNGDTIDDRARTLVTANTSEAIPSTAIERIRFDCPSGRTVQPAEFGCRPVETADSAGQLFPPATAAVITCSLSFSAP